MRWFTNESKCLAIIDSSIHLNEFVITKRVFHRKILIKIDGGMSTVCIDSTLLSNANECKESGSLRVVQNDSARAREVSGSKMGMPNR